MRTPIVTLLSALIFTVFLIKPAQAADRVTIDFEMVEKGIQWLQFMNTGAHEKAVKKYFMNHVAPTNGCQSIIHHWARFMEWDNETFYNFILAALGMIQTDKKLKNDDGSLTSFGRRQELWTNALRNTAKLKKDLETLKTIDFNKQSILIAKKYLPPGAILKADFYFVLFGASTAFSVGKENGYDFLQLSRQEDGAFNIPKITRVFAHEMHHTGFEYLSNKNTADVKNKENFLLIGILAAEGMPTYFIDRIWEHLDEYRSSKDSLDREIAADWEKHTARLPELYREAEKDIRLNMGGKIGQKQIMAKWMAGIKGPAYILGGNMIGVIDKYLGRKAALDVALDYRRFLIIYNRAARKAVKKGDKVFVFADESAKITSR